MPNGSKNTYTSSSVMLALIECLLFLTIFFVLAWYFEMVQNEGTYGWYSKLIMILLGLVGILLHGDPRQYGLVPKNLRFSLKWCAYVFLLFIGFGFLGVLVGISLGIASLKANLEILVVDFIWYLIFVGFAEELFFRGFIQSRLNEVFTKKYKKIFDIEFEWTQGTLITAIFFFGLPHLLVMVNPFTGRIEFSVFALIVSFIFAPFLGVIFGIIREKTGCIMIVSILHAVIDFVVFGIGRITGMLLSNITVAMALFVFFGGPFEKILRSEI